MPEYRIVSEQIERRTYLKGKFKGKFVGYFDSLNSDGRIENFYDLEVLSAEIFTDKHDFRVWMKGGEFDEFTAIEKFLTKLPETICCHVADANGSIKHFQIKLHEPKLTDYKLTDRLQESDKLFAVLEGEISGYLKHFDIIEKQVEVVPPAAPDPLPRSENRRNFAVWKENYFRETPSGNHGLRQSAGSNLKGCLNFAFIINDLEKGCIYIISGISGFVLILYFLGIILSVWLAVISPILEYLTLILAKIPSHTFSTILLTLIIGVAFYLFVKLSHKLTPIWQWIFRFLLAFLLLCYFSSDF